MKCCECDFFTTGIATDSTEYHECGNHDCPVLTPLACDPACEFSRPRKENNHV